MSAEPDSAKFAAFSDLLSDAMNEGGYAESRCGPWPTTERDAVLAAYADALRLAARSTEAHDAFSAALRDVIGGGYASLYAGILDPKQYEVLEMVREKILDLESSIEERAVPDCVWTYDERGGSWDGTYGGSWGGTCGVTWILTDLAHDHEMKFCPRCGGALIVVPR